MTVPAGLARDRGAPLLVGLLLAALVVLVLALWGAYSLGLKAGRPLGREDVLQLDAAVAEMPAVRARIDSALAELASLRKAPGMAPRMPQVQRPPLNPQSATKP